ncbi:hypothetical protein [Escherichia coli]|uniref:hypothetical protein n=1 Tax=Escherichia coli TaxID=562 RepID=UPI000DD8D907|nr:hypothetical protein [Escherichia coli]MCE3732082.1 hypothetical protein [Escherichia coli]QBF94221.1 hypothetical protein EYD11_25755 [Escherichia coli]RXP23698.1 hypothetical protein D9K54_25185 [Escherichia coli]
MGSCAAPSAKGDDKFITTDYLQQCRFIQDTHFALVPNYFFSVLGGLLGYKKVERLKSCKGDL